MILRMILSAVLALSRNWPSSYYEMFSAIWDAVRWATYALIVDQLSGLNSIEDVVVVVDHEVDLVLASRRNSGYRALCRVISNLHLEGFVYEVCAP